MRRFLLPALLASTALTSSVANESFASESQGQPMGEAAKRPSISNPLVESNSSKQKIPLKDKNLYEDDNFNSASSCIAFDNKPSHAVETKRILSLAGGGIRGTYEATLICVLEELLNVGNEGPWKHIVDEFQVVGGTSTGSLLAAGLVYKPTIPGLERYKAMDILKMYVRYGYKIFDEHARLGKGVNAAKYGSDGLDNIIGIYFGSDTNFKDNVTKPLYVFAHNMDTNLPVIHSTRNVPTRTTSGPNYLLAKALGESTAAPSFFPGRIMLLNGRAQRVNDGGMICNQPAKIIYDQELLKDQSLVQDFKYEIFALGTGAINKPTEKTLSEAKQVNLADLDKGVVNVSEIIGGVFSTQVNTAVEACNHVVMDSKSGANFFAHLNPRVEKDYMDDTSPGYSQYMMQKAFDMLMDAAITQGSVFQITIERLGLSMPNSLKMGEVIRAVTTKLYEISLDTIEEIMGNEPSEFANPQKVALEKEWILKVLSTTISPTVAPNTVELFYYLRPEHNMNFDSANRFSLLNKLVEQAQASNGTSWIPEGWTGTNWTMMKKLLSDNAEFDEKTIGLTNPDLSKNSDEIALTLVEEFSHLCKPKLVGDSSTLFLATNFIKRQLTSFEENLIKANGDGRRDIFKKMESIAVELITAGNAHNKAAAEGIAAQSQSYVPLWASNMVLLAYNAVTEAPKTAIAATTAAVVGTVSLPVAGITYVGYSYFHAPELEKGTFPFYLYSAYKLYVDNLRQKFGQDHRI